MDVCGGDLIATLHCLRVVIATQQIELEISLQGWPYLNCVFPSRPSSLGFRSQVSGAVEENRDPVAKAWQLQAFENVEDE